MFSSPNKKVLFIIPSLTHGGVEKFALEYATSLKAKGHWPVVVGVGKNGPLSAFLIERGIEHYALKLRFFEGQSRWSFLRNSWAFYSHTKPINAEVWIGASYWCNILVGLIGPLAKAKKRIWSQRSVDTFIVKGRLEHIAKKGITHYTANGIAPLTHIVERHGIQRSEVCILTNVLEHRLWNIDLKAKAAKPTECFRILMVANYFPEKLQSMAIEAVSKVRKERPDISFRLDLLGTAPGGYTVELNKALAFDLKLDTQVFFHESNANKDDLFQHADVGLLATLSEGYSNSVVEYMAYGLPILASDILANRDALGDEFPSAFFENTAEGLSNAIVAMYDNPALMIEMGKRNRQRVLERHVFEPAQRWPF